MSNRKEVESFILKYIDKIAPGGENKKLYEELFSNMDDDQFDKFMTDLDNGNRKLSVICPNFSKNKLSVERNLSIAKELSHEFFQRIWIPATDTIPSYLTPIKYLVVDLPLRRQAQLLNKKISVPENNNTVDNTTGQPTGNSKGATCTFFEVQVLSALNMEKSLLELMKYRGGDAKGFNAMNTIISRNGAVSQKAIEPYSGIVKSTHTFSVMLNGMHLKNTLNK
jgi:hypothetical protein